MCKMDKYEVYLRTLKSKGDMFNAFVLNMTDCGPFKFRTWPFIIKSPKQYKNLSFMDAMNKFKWAKKEGLSFNKLVLSLPVNVRCSKTDNAEWSVSPTLFSSLKKLDVTFYLIPNRLNLRNRQISINPAFQLSFDMSDNVYVQLLLGLTEKS